MEITEKFKKFVNKLSDQGFITIENNSVHINMKKLCSLKNWPDQLDTENFEITGIYENVISGFSGGDWQDMVRFNIVYDKNKIELRMFDDPACYTASGKYSNKDILNALSTESIKESLITEFFKK